MNPQELAEEFWNMDSAQQADFFNILADIIEENQCDYEKKRGK